MKKYLILGIALAVVAILLSSSFKQESKASTSWPPPCSFYGTATGGDTITAYLLHTGIHFHAVGNKSNLYYFPKDLPYGDYELWWGGCQNQGASYQGVKVEVNFCVKMPGHDCPCW